MIKLLDGKESQHYHVNTNESAVVIGMQKKCFAFTPVTQLLEHTDMEHRIPQEQWWMKLRSLMRILAKHENVYVSEVLKKDYSDEEEIDTNEMEDNANIITA